MATSPHFNNYSKGLTGEQLLLEDMINELIYVAGTDVYYIKRDSDSEIDLVFGEDPTSAFTKYWQIEMYIKDVEGWSGGGDFFSKFGLQINKQTNLIVARRAFRKYVPEEEMLRPREGDLIWIPVMQKLFEISFVDKEQNFYTHGKVDPYYYELQLELFKYSQERIDTTIDEIDIVERENSYVIEFPLISGTGNYVLDEPVYQGANLASATATANVHSWDIANSKLSVYNINGVFANNVTIVGEYSLSEWTTGSYDDQEDHEDYRYYTNSVLESEANDTFVRTETNPFGKPWKDE